MRRAGTAAVRASLIGAVIGGLATLTIAFVANRYMSDLLPAIVLASLAADLRALVAVGEPHVIGSWRIERDGRKCFSGVALWDAAGHVCAAGRALWIELR